jgi:hypothetical protein
MIGLIVPNGALTDLLSRPPALHATPLGQKPLDFAAVICRLASD